MTPAKKPVSVLVVIHTADLRVLLLERASRAGLIYTLELTIAKEHEPAIEIYRRTGGPHGPH